ncbi:MAG: T9SS type A sorting domain-containing protein, partial [Ignavibacteria bacterium]|nr:T9SS type A sorting domain-containing protein [Ignavibacteria bacterium]
SPIDESINQPINGLEFIWNKSEERIETIQNYHFQLSTDSLFSTLVEDDSLLTDTTKTINGLAYFTEYYWRVRASNQIGWGDWSDIWQTKTIIEKPEIPALISPISGVNGLVQPVTLVWNSSVRTEKYELEVSTDSLFSVITYSDTTLTDTTTNLPQLSNLTTYYWRVRAKNIGGMSDNSEVRNFKTIGVPTVVNLLTPQNDSIHVPINVNFIWSSASDQLLKTVSNYWFELTSDTSSGTFTSQDTTLTDTTKSVNGLDYLTNYFWRVKSKNEAGWGNFTNWNKFTTIIEKPEIPNLATPLNGANGLVQPVTLTWNSSLRSEKYELEVSTDLLFGTIVFSDTTLTDTSKTLPELSILSTYYWRVRAKNIGGISNYSEVRDFRTIGVPNVVNLLIPRNDSIHVPINTTFYWSKATDQLLKSISNYWFELTTDTTSGLFVNQDSSLTDTTTLVNNLDFLTEYFWRVKSKNEAGWGNFTEWNKFTTIIEKPEIPLLESPLSGTNGLIQPITLLWNSSVRTEKYELEVSTDSLFSLIAYSDTTLTDTTKVLPELSNLTTYYWRVRAKNIGGMSDNSEVRNFRTIGVPTNVTLLFPRNDSIHVPLNVDFKWTKSEDQILKTVSNYWFQLTSDTTSSSFVSNDSTLTDTLTTVNGLDYFTNFYWRIKSRNEAGWSEFTDWFTFRTIIEKPDQIVLSQPINNSVGVVQPTTLSWLVSDRAEKYEIEVASDSLFSTIVYTDTTIIEISHTIPILQNLTDYYWRVRGKNIGGIGDYSETFTFRTLGVPTVVNLVWPVDTSIHQNINQTFVWTKAVDQLSKTVSNYWFELITDTTSNIFVVQDSTITDTTRFDESLQYLTPYFWRVKGKNEAGWGDFSTWNKFTTIIERPVTPILLSPSDGVDGLVKPIVFDWGTAERAEYYHIQIASDSLFTQIAVEDTNIYSLQFIDSSFNDLSTYYWRVRGVNIGGKSDFTTHFSFRTLGVPYPVVLNYPGADSINLPISITFNWLKGTDQRTVSTYWFELVRDTIIQTGLIRDTIVTDTSKTVSGLINLTNYYWRVKAQNEVGWGDFSEWRKFSTIILPPAVPVLHSPGSADVIQVGVTQPITFKWNSALRVERYHIEVSRDELFRTNDYSDSTLTDTSVVVPKILQDLEFYYWRVRAINVGGSSAYSTVFKFKTIGIPNTVILSVPTANTVNQPIDNLTFKWFKATEQRSIGRYWFELNQDTTSSTSFIRDTSLTDTLKVVNGLQHLTTYYWRVRAENQAGWSGFSFWRKFTTIIQRPDAVVLSTPEDQSLNQELLVTLTWFKSPRAERYELRVARDTAFTQLVDSSDVLTDTSFTLPTLNYFTNYYWKVRAVNINSPGDYSPRYSFSTLLPSTTLISPANNSVDLARNVTFRWNAANAANQYKLQIAATSAFSNIIIDTTVTGTTITLGPLTNNSTYYWRVRSVNGSSHSVYTSPFKFTVYEPVLTILTPNGGESLRSGSSKDIKWNVRIPTEQMGKGITKTNIADDNEFTFNKSESNGDGSVLSNFTFVIIQYSIDNGTSWVNIDSLIQGSQETYNWIVPAVSSEECKIRILDFTNRERGDTTDAVFTIYKPSLVLTHPNTPVVWRSGSQKSIEWTSNDVQTVRIDFSTNNGAAWFTIQQNQPADSGKYTWTVPAITSTECKIRILADNNLSVGDTSDVPFTVAVPIVTLLSPFGNENWETGLNYEVKWTSQYSEWLKIQYTTNTGTDWLTVIDSVPASANSFSWLIPNTPSTTVRLRIFDGEDSSFSDTSGTFTIYRPGITVVNPVPEEQIKVGIKKTIQWESNNVNSVNIEYSTDNGENWLLVASSVSSFAPGLKSYEWTVPNTPSDLCMIRITDVERPNTIGLSSSNFSIYVKIPRIFTTLFQNPVLTRYAEVVVISDTLLSENPFVQITGPTDTTLIDMSQTGNSKFAYNGSVQFKASGSYTLFVSIKTVQGIENDTSRNFNVEQVIPGKPAIVKSLDNKGRLNITGNELNETTFFLADMEKIKLVSDDEKLHEETIYIFSPVKELTNSLSLEFDYSDFTCEDEGKLFIFQEVETSDGILWQPLRSQVYTSTKTIKTHVNKLGKFKLGYDAEFSGTNIVPNEFKVSQNFPNPFNPETNINYSIPVDGDLSIIVYDVLGREVEVLKSEFTLAGQYNTKWSASKNASGIYFLVIRIAEYRDIKKMVLMK